jgi:hypothetical protein
MTRYGKVFLVTGALACAGLSGAASVARGEQAAGKRGGVLFYAGFDQSKDATYAAGDPKAKPLEGGGSLNADGLGVRGSAFRTGDGEGYIEFSAEGNIKARQGTIEFWLKAEDWEKNDDFFHRFIDVLGDGAISFHMYPDGVNHFVVRAPGVSEPTHWEDFGPHVPGLGNRAYGSPPVNGKWVWLALTWEEGKTLGCWTGRANFIHNNSYAGGPRTPAPGKLLKMLIGDFGGEPGRKVHTLIDEIYIYDRALSKEELAWATENALTRKRGMDIPADFMQPKVKVVPDPANSTLVVHVDSGDRSGNFAGTACLEPDADTSPAPIAPTDGRLGRAVIPYVDLPQGAYNIISELTTKDGKPIASITTPFVVPGPPVWLEEKVGVSDTPPPPWTPVEVEGNSVKVWGREYQLGAFGLPAKVQTHGASILAGPISFRTVCGGTDVNWEEQKRDMVIRTEAEVAWEGTSRSALGELHWRTQAEYDGFLLHDLSLTPAGGEGAAVELMELRIPIRGEFAQLYSLGARKRGLLPKGEGSILSADRYWWIGTDDFGFCGATEHDGALIEGADGAYSIVREANGDVAVIYRFAAKQTALTEPWTLRLVLQATPTKPLPADWRTWRDGTSHPAEAMSHPVQLSVTYPWPHAAAHRHFAFPVVKDPNWYRSHVKNLHAGAKGMWRDSDMLQKEATPDAKRKLAVTKVIPYSMFAFMAPGMPECEFYWKQWYNPLGMSSLGGGFYQYVAVRPVPSYIDFMTWKHRELIREYGHDGLYVDFAGSCQAVLDLEHGMGYERGGIEHPASFPIVANREMWKRMYTMLQQESPSPIIIGHVSENTYTPVLSFCDIWLDGEMNWFGLLKDNYLEVLPLDELRAEFRAQHFGGIPWWLVQFHRAALEDKDVIARTDNGSVGTVTVEKTHHMFGIGLLLDIGFWPGHGMNMEGIRQVCAVQDEFGIGDAQFLGYWNNAKFIGGQTEAVKASAYRKPQGGALMVIYNTSREVKTAKLDIAWDKLKSGAALEVFDAYTKEPVAVSGSSLTLDVPPLNYRLLWVR